jgi:hypothetical protein
MSTANIQGIHAQTPGVERAHQNRPQQMDTDQRQYTTISERAQDQKMKEAQEAAEDREAQIQLEKEQERNAKDKRKRGQQGEEEEVEAMEEAIIPAKGQKKPGVGDHIDITL